MQETKKINEQVTVGPQPKENELAQLRDQGFQSVVNFRTDQENDQPMTPHDEEGKVIGKGMKYCHIPVSPDDLDEATVDRFREEFRELPKPVFAHCKSGMRAGAMVLMHLAGEQGWSGEETLDKAKEMGFECNHPKLRDFVKTYTDKQQA